MAGQALPYSNKDFNFSLIMPFLGFFFIRWIAAPWLGAADHMGIGVTLFTLCFIALLGCWFSPGRGLLRQAPGVYLILILLAGGYFSLYENSLLQGAALAFLMVAAAYFVLVLGESRIEKKLGSYLFWDMLTALARLPFGHFGKLAAVLADGVKKKRNGGGVLMLLAGMLLILPVCLYISTLLQSADAAFEQFWLHTMKNFMQEAVIAVFQFLVALPVSMYLYGLFYGALKPGDEARPELENAAKLAAGSRILPLSFVMGGLTPLLLLYVLFFFSQTAYFLSAFSGFLPQGMIYSEYARRGFFELCTVSTINLVFIAVLLFFTRKSAGGGQRPSRIYGGLLSVFSIALIVISLSKMLLYIDIYGLTPKRLYTSWFMVFLLLVFLFVIIRLWRPGFNMIKCWAVAAAVMFLLLCYANTDGLIARYNVEGYYAGRLKQLDAYSLDALGPEATPWLIRIMTDEQTEPADRKIVREILQNRVSYDSYREDSRDWRSLTLSGYRSRRLLAAYQDLIFTE